MAFTPQITQAIEGFAANLGVPARPARDGSYSFRFERSGTLTLTASEDGARALLSLATAPLRVSEDLEWRILSLAGPDVTTGRFLSAGLARDGSAMFAVGVDEEEMSLPALETCLQQLMQAAASVS
jgi:type III secretion system chaperone SycN